MQMTGQAWLVLDLTKSPLSLAVLTTLQFLPVMLFSLLGGAAADRFPKRKLLIVTQTVGALQALALGMVIATGQVALWHIYLTAFVLGCVNSLDAPLRQAFVAGLVQRSAMPNALALAAMAQNVGRIVGPALAGVAIATAGVGTTFFLNAVAFGVFLVLVYGIRASTAEVMAKAERKSLSRDIAEGLRYAANTPVIAFLLIATTFIGVFGQNFSTMVPLVAEFVVNASAEQFGLLNSFLGIGSFAAALSMSMRGAPTIARILSAGALFGIVLIGIAFAEDLRLSCILFGLIGACAVTFSTSVHTAIQLNTPPEMRGRLASIINLLIVGSSPIGALLTGTVADVWDVSAAVSLNGALSLGGVLLSLAYFIHLRRHGTFLRISDN